MATLRDLENIEALKAEAQIYQTWKSKTTSEKQTLYTASQLGTRIKPVTDKVLINQFNNSKILIRVNNIVGGGEAIQASCYGMIDNFLILSSATPPADYTIDDFAKGRRFSKLKLTEALEAGSRLRTSRIRGTRYTQRPSNSISSKFGQGKTVTPAQETAKATTTVENSVTNFEDAKELIGAKATTWVNALAEGAGYRGYKITGEN